MSQFDEIFADSVLPVLGDLFAGPVGVYTPADGSGPISCALVVTGTTARNSERRTEDLVETYFLQIPAATVASVSRGDQYVRPSSEDPDTRPLVCSGEFTYRSAAYGVWKFTRSRRLVQGVGAKA